MIGAPLAAPIVEETLKGIGIVLLFWLVRGEFDNVRDGFIYGALVGAGFNWFESALYVQQNFAQFGTAPYGFQLGMRYAWLGLAGHAMFSGIFGASLGLARLGRGALAALLRALAGYLLAVLGHAWNNALPLLMALASAQAGESPPTEVQAPPATRPVRGNDLGQRLEPGHLPAVRVAARVDHPAQRPMGTGRHPRRARRGDGRSVTPESTRPSNRCHFAHAANRRPRPRRLGGARERAERARVPQAAAAATAASTRSWTPSWRDGARKSRRCAPLHA